jgi:septal ring factor EnvC (AmiA/AmiB activator)
MTPTDYIPWIIAVCSLLITLYFNSSSKKRVDTDEIESKAKTDAEIKFRLDESLKIGRDTNTKVDKISNDVSSLSERTVRLEESTKSLWKSVNRIDSELHAGSQEDGTK